MNTETNPAYAVKQSLVSCLADKPYFFGVRQCANDLAVIVESNDDAAFTERAIRQLSNGTNVCLQNVSSLADYLAVACNVSRPNLSLDYLAALRKVSSYLRAHTLSKHEIYSSVLILDRGFSQGVIDFLYLAEDTLFLYKTGVSKGHKEMRLRNRVLGRSADFFEMRFGKYFNKIHAFAAYNAGRFIEVQKKFERSLQKI